MELLETKTVDLYKGFEGEPGFFILAADKEENVHYYLKAWEGYVHNIFFEHQHAFDGKFIGFSKLILEFVINDVDYALDNFYVVEDKTEMLKDLIYQRDHYINELNEEEKKFLNSFIELVELAIERGLNVLIANDED